MQLIMKYKKTVLFLIIFLPIMANSQKINPRTYSVLKDYFKETQTVMAFPFILHSKVLSYYNPWISFDSVLQESFMQKEMYSENKAFKKNMIFSESDFQFMKNEIKSSVSLQFLSKRKLEKAGILTTDSLNLEQLLQPQPTIYKVSLPLFSKNGQTVLLYTEYFCIGDCGSGDIYILIRKKGKWQLLASYNVWIS